MDSTQHDDLLFSMLQECKTLPVFLNNVFGFLNRRTDFYHVSEDLSCPVGLPPGLAEQTVKQIFHKWKPKEEPLNQSPPRPAPVPKPVDFTKSESYNGAVYDTYSWSQNLTEIDIIITVPEGITSKDLQIDFQADSISVKLKSGAVLLEGALCSRVKHNEAIWSLSEKLEIHLDKAKEIWWRYLVEGEPQLDLNRLDCSRPYEELSEEAQAKIDELQWNQERKRLGLPTSDQLQVHQILEKSWHAEGSPFSGPFDPTIVKFN